MTNSAYQIVQAARAADKISTRKLIAGLVTDFQPMAGDRQYEEDPALIGGIGWLGDQAVTILATNKGETLAESQACHFGCVSPAGYRKAIRLMHQAAKFNRPVINLINTPGANPDVNAEYLGQGDAIAQSIMTGLQLSSPSISVIFGEAGSGGALALACADEVWMWEHSTYSVLSPEGYASILWRDAKLADKAADKMKLTPAELLADGYIDRVVPEVTDGSSMMALKQGLISKLTDLTQQPQTERLAARHERYRQF